jgi:hypothetical protein
MPKLCDLCEIRDYEECADCDGLGTTNVERGHCIYCDGEGQIAIWACTVEGCPNYGDADEEKRVLQVVGHVDHARHRGHSALAAMNAIMMLGAVADYNASMFSSLGLPGRRRPEWSPPAEPPFSGVDFGFRDGHIPSPYVDEIKAKAEARRERKRQRNLRLAGRFVPESQA